MSVCVCEVQDTVRNVLFNRHNAQQFLKQPMEILRCLFPSTIVAQS